MNALVFGMFSIIGLFSPKFLGAEFTNDWVSQELTLMQQRLAQQNSYYFYSVASWLSVLASTIVN